MSRSSVDGLPIPSDSVFQRKLRALQSSWREENGLPIGQHNGRPLGSRMAMPFAKKELANYLTPTIRDVVDREVVKAGHGQQKLYSAPRIFDDLLSSQPLCFNLFGELSADLRAATAVCRLLWPTVVHEVTAVEFEWSPGRGDDRFLGNRSAFDVAVFHTTPSGGEGFVGIEVKYHENLRVKAAETRTRCDEVATKSGAFRDPSDPELRRSPLNQIWLDHLLALAMLQADSHRERGRFVFLYPAGNAPCSAASARYEEELRDPTSFERLTLEAVVGAIRWATGAPWIEQFNDRYLVPHLPADQRLPGDEPSDQVAGRLCCRVDDGARRSRSAHPLTIEPGPIRG